MKTLISLILTLTLIACDQPYEDGEDVEFDSEVEVGSETEFEQDTDTVEVDSDCLYYGPMTVGYEPRCVIYEDGSGIEAVRSYSKGVCVNGVASPLIVDHPCDNECVTVEDGQDYCFGQEGEF